MGDAPLSGQWFAAQFTELVQNAYPAIGSAQPKPRDPSEDGATPSPDPTASTVPAAGECSANLVLRDEWSTGFVADVTVTAGGSIAGWSVVVPLPDGTSIVDQWTGEFSGTSGTVSVGDAGWNGPLEGWGDRHLRVHRVGRRDPGRGARLHGPLTPTHPSLTHQ
ncbi:cellulose binding domain-containing protein [Demequina litorisediminis]|nr:cellulose binding domain-containing protein [Demequina litorisediminis]